MRCLLVRTPDKREYLTLVKNYPLLIEYANTFKARLYTVETAGMPPVLSICERPVRRRGRPGSGDVQGAEEAPAGQGAGQQAA